MKLELNKSYINNNNETVKIVSKDEYDKSVFIDNFGRSYFENGKYYYDNRKFDLNDNNFL